MPASDIQIALHVLLIDDEPAILRTLGNHLKARGHRVYTAGGGQEGVEILRREVMDIVVVDVKMPGMDGFDVLKEVRRNWPGVEVIMVTAYGDIDTAVRAMREGAFDFFAKPVKLQELVASLQRTERFHALRRENRRYRDHLDRLGTEAKKSYGLSAIIGQSPASQNVRKLIEQVCQTDATTVLVCGETGTGKELVARAIHTESARSRGPFVAVDCSAIPHSLMESEFYGHEKGAFTDARNSRKGHFELADGGSLFLDEIGDMDLAMQGRLLRTLEERTLRRVGGANELPVDIRVISATNRDLPEAVLQGTFRKDLYYRLNAFTIWAPPLRERPEDILPLAHHFLHHYAQEMRKPVDGFTPEAAEGLEAHLFPGNVRELRNMIERAVILCSADRVALGDLYLPSGMPEGLTPDGRSHAGAGQTPADAVAPAMKEDLNLAEVESTLIQEALRRSDGNQVQAANLLGISRTALRRRMARYGIGRLESRV